MDPITAALGLSQFVPWVMRFFGIGEKPVKVAEELIGIAKKVTGETTSEGAVAALRANVELAQKFQTEVLAADAALEKIALADRESARARDVEVRKYSAGTNTRADVMVAGAVLGLIACLAVMCLFRKDIPGEAVGIISTIAGIFGACLKDAYAFEFGSSRGSKEKDALIASMTERGS